ncbi:MAG: hypothetical protein WC693_00795 [Patescibacteria group bacterium]|jgi:hypothetical protein
MSDFLEKYSKDIRVRVKKTWLFLGKREFSEKKKVSDIMDYYLPRYQKCGIITNAIEEAEKDDEYLPVRLKEVYALAQTKVNEDHFKSFYDYDDVPAGDILIFYHPAKEIYLVVDGVHRLGNRAINQDLDEEITCHYLQSKYLPRASRDIKIILERS